MCRKLILLLTLVLGTLFLVEARGADPATAALVRRGVEFYEKGRWSDARHELLRAQPLLSPDERLERERVEYYLAATAVELGDEDAEQDLLRFINIWPESVYGNDARFALAMLYSSKGEMKAANEALRNVNVELLDRGQREQYNLRMGYVCFMQKRYPEALNYFGRIASSSPYADHALYYKSYIDYTSGRHAEAKQGFSRLTTSGAYGPLAPYYLLQLEFLEGNYTYVTQHGDKLAAKSAPAHRAGISRIMAESWYHLGEFNKTIEYLTAFELDGGKMARDEHYLMGYALYRTARYADAEEHLRLASGPDDALTQNASYHLADCYVRRNAKREAMQSFSLAANEKFDSAIAEEALFNYGKLQYELGGGLFNEAINLLTRYIATYGSSPRAAQARQLLIAAYYNSHSYEAAYEAIKGFDNPDADIRAALQKITYFRALKAFEANDLAGAKQMLLESSRVGVSPKYNALTLFWQGEIAYAEGDYVLAETRYSNYLKRAPRTAAEYPLAYYNLAYSRFSQQKLAAAKDDFTQFLALRSVADGYRLDALNRLGDTQMASRLFDDAVASYGKVVKSNGSEKYYAAYQRALTLGLQHKSNDKIVALKQIVADGQGDYVDDAAYELGHTYLSQEQYGEGARSLERFIEEHPASPLRTQALSDLGLAHLNLGDKAKSLKYYDLVVTSAPHSAEAKGAMEGIRDIYVSKGDVDSYFDYAKSVGLEGDVSVMSRDSLTFTAAQRLYLAEKHNEAAHALKNYTDNYPKGYYTTDALYYLSDCYLRLDKRIEAIQTLSALTQRGATSYSVAALERLSSMTMEDKRFPEAADAYRRLYDVARTAPLRGEAMTGHVRATLAQNDNSKIAPLAADVAAQKDAGAIAVRESQFALAEQLREQGKSADAMKIYRSLSDEVKSEQGATSAYYVLQDIYDAGDMAKAEKAIFSYTNKNTPHAYWLARAYILLGDVYLKKGDKFQARATYQSVVDGYSPATDGIVGDAKSRIAKMN